MERALNTNIDTLYDKNVRRLPDLQVALKKDLGAPVRRRNRHFAKSNRSLDPYILVDCFELCFYTTSSAFKIHELLWEELGLPVKPLSHEAKLDFIKTYKSDKSIDQANDKSLRVISQKDRDGLYSLTVKVKNSVSRKLKQELMALSFYDEEKERKLCHELKSADPNYETNVVDLFAVSKKGLQYLSVLNKTITNKLICAEIECRQYEFSVKLAKLETCYGLNTWQIDADQIKLVKLLAYLGNDICDEGETHYDVYLKTTKVAVKMEHTRRFCHLKVYKKLKADSRPGQIRLELVEHNISIKDDCAIDNVLDDHQLFLKEVGGWLLACLDQKTAISNSSFKVLNRNADFLKKPLYEESKHSEQMLPKELKPYMQKLKTKMLLGQWVLKPEYSQFIIRGN